MPGRTDEERISWIEGCVPDTEETCVVHALIARGVRTRHALARAVADELAARDARRAGIAGNAGLFRDWYEAGAERLLERLNGRTIMIEHGT